jgi:hypothetical protein
MPSGPVEDKHGVSARRHLGRNFIEMPLHGVGVATGQDEARADATCGTDGTEDIGRLGALVLGRRGPAAAFRPASGELGLLADSGLILPPDFYIGVGREDGADLRQLGGKLFL